MATATFKNPKPGDPRLEEFPLGCLDRGPLDKKSLMFEAQVESGKEVVNCKLKINAGKGLQVPAAGDVNILLALVHLSKEAGLKEKVLFATRYQLAMLLGDRSDQTYERINRALELWQKTSFVFLTETGSPGDLTTRTKTFTAVEKVEETEGAGGKFRLTWSDAFWYAFGQGAWQTVDLKEALELRPVTQRLLCLVESRFRGSATVVFPLSQLVIHLGLAEKPVFRILQQIRKACRELEELNRIPADEGRFMRAGKEWRVSFKRAEPIAPVENQKLEASV